MAALVDKSIPTVASLYNAILHWEGSRWRGPGKTLLFDIAYRLAHKVLFTKLVNPDGDICPYFSALMLAALAWV